MNKLLKKMMVALLSLSLVQAVWADNVPDFKKTLQAAEQGYAKAQFNLGLIYYNGQGVSQDYTQAVQWYRKAAEQGVAQAQYNLGVMYANGQGIRQDDAQAVQWFLKAAEQGVAEAQFNLGLMYDQGQGVHQDDAEAVQWYRKAAEQGYADAQFYLGVAYWNGIGVTVDKNRAKEWYKKSCENGFSLGCEVYLAKAENVYEANKYKKYARGNGTWPIVNNINQVKGNRKNEYTVRSKSRVQDKYYSSHYYGQGPKPTAKCRNGTFSYSLGRRGVCSRNGGVAVWY